MSNKLKSTRRKRQDRRLQEVVYEMFVTHFGQIRGSDVDGLCCGDCEDRRVGVCRGEGLHGWDIFDCMLEKVIFGKEGVVVHYVEHR